MSIKDKEIRDEDYFIVLNSEYFDEEWYSSNYDLDGFDSAYHYLYIGFKKGFNPGPNFNTIDYFASNPDVEQLGRNPLVHYERHGKHENRQIELSEEEKEKRNSAISNSEYFDEEWYSSNYDLDGFDPVYHYLYIGFKKGFNPGPNFSTKEYYECNPGVEKEGVNPLLHYELYGRKENRKIRHEEVVVSPYVSVTDELEKYYPSESENHRILLCGHSLNEGGAEILLKNIIQEFRKKDIEVAVLVKNDGILRESYEEMAPTFICENDEKIEYYVGELNKVGYNGAILNTVLCGNFVQILHKFNIFAINLIHELPYIIKLLNAEKFVKTIAEESDLVVFPSNYVAEKFESFYPVEGRKLIQPQGLYNLYNNFNKEESKNQLVKKYNIPKDDHIILNVGLGEYRKGFDLFYEVSKKLKNENYSFFWVGHINQEMKNLYLDEINKEKSMIYTGFISDKEEMMSYYDACDIFMLTSREDPFPSVILEAFNAKKPVIAFEDAGGFQDIVINNETGFLVEYESVDALVDKIRLLSNDNDLKERLGENAKKVCEEHNFSDYVEFLKTRCIEGEKDYYKQNYSKLSNLVIDLKNIISDKDEEISYLKEDINSKENTILSLKMKNIHLNKEVNNEILSLEDKNKKLIRKNKQLSNQKKEILSSTSWKITSPLRKVKNNVRKLHMPEVKISKNNNNDVKTSQPSRKSNLKSIDKLNVLPIEKVYSQIYNSQYSYKTYILNEEMNRVNLFFDKIDKHINRYYNLFAFIIDFCNKKGYSLRIIYDFADFEEFRDFLMKNKLKLPENTTFLNLKNENYLEIGFDEKNICSSWKCAKRIMNTPAINDMIYLYLGNLKGYSADEYFQISNISYNSKVVILNDDIDKLKDLKRFNYNYNLKISKKITNETKILCCDFGDMFLEGINLLNYMIFNKIIDINKWDIQVISKNNLSKINFNGIISLIPEKLDEYDLFLKLSNYNEKTQLIDENYIELFVEEVDDDNYNLVDIMNEELEDFSNRDSSKLERLQPLWPIEEIFNKIEEVD